MFEPATANSFLKVEPRMANFFSHMVTKSKPKLLMWNIKIAPCCPQKMWAWRLLMWHTFGYVDESKHSAQTGSKKLIIEICCFVSTRTAATYFPSFSSKAPWGQSCDLLLVFGKSHCNQQFLQGNNHMAPFVLPFSKSFRQLLQMQHIHHSHIISMIVGEKAKNLPTVKLVAIMTCQVYQITLGRKAMLDSGMVAAAGIIPAVPNLCSQRNQSPSQRLCLQQTWLNCKHIRVWKPFHLKGHNFRVHRPFEIAQVLNQCCNSSWHLVLSLHTKGIGNTLVLGQHLVKVQKPMVLLDQLPIQVNTLLQAAFCCFQKLQGNHCTMPSGLKQVHEAQDWQKGLHFFFACIGWETHHSHIVCNNAA